MFDDAGVDGLLETGVDLAKVMAKLVTLDGRLGEVLVEDGGVGHGLVRRGQEDDLAVGGLGHRLHSLEVADLHSRSRREDVGGLTHKLGGLDLYERERER